MKKQADFFCHICEKEFFKGWDGRYISPCEHVPKCKKPSGLRILCAPDKQGFCKYCGEEI